MWKNIVEPKVTIRLMRIACWITKTTHTHTTCNIHCLSTATMVARTRLSVTFYVHCLFCYYFILLIITYIGILCLRKLNSDLKKQTVVS